jgi:uncharacterized protein
MKIGIMSDSHDRAEFFVKALEFFKEHNVVMIIHCGDWVAPFMLKYTKTAPAPIVGVFGNNEGSKELFHKIIEDEKITAVDIKDLVNETKVDGKKIAVTHGHHLDTLRKLIQSQQYDLICSGHTHEPIIKQINKTLHINPGALLGSRDWNFAYEKTVALYDTKKKEGNIHRS